MRNINEITWNTSNEGDEFVGHNGTKYILTNKEKTKVSDELDMIMYSFIDEDGHTITKQRVCVP